MVRNEAGRAFFILQGKEARDVSRLFPENPLPVTLPAPPWKDSIPAGVLTDARFTQVPTIPSPLKIVATVRHWETGAYGDVWL